MQKKRSPAEWGELVRKQKASGQGVKEWCVENGINVNVMYNQITRHRKLQSKSEHKQEMIETILEKENSVAIEWKEIKSDAMQQHSTPQRNSIFIEIGDMRLEAGGGYPVVNLAMLCKELLGLC